MYPIAMTYWWMDVQMWMWDWLLWFFIGICAFLVISVVAAIWFGERNDRR